MKFIDKAKMLFSNNAWDEYVRSFLRGDEYPPGTEMNINSETAMKYTAVFACVRVLSETLAAMPIMLYKKKADGDREPKNDLIIYDVLHNAPNPDMSPFSFKEAGMISLNTGGNMVAEKMVNYLGEVVGLSFYPWAAVEIKRDKENGALIYEIAQQNGEKRTLTRAQVFHLPGLSLDGYVGVSPISYAASAIRLGLSYEQFGVSFYKNGAHASGVFSFPNELSQPAFDRLKADLTKNYTGLTRVGKPMLLEGGGKFEPLTINPVDAQLLESKKFQTEDIARIYRVPLHLIQNLDKASFANIEHQSLEFVMYTMLPWFKRWEEAINQQLLTRDQRRAGYYFEFKIDTLLRGDAKARAESYAAGRQWGWLSVNDIRKLENMSPIPNGDIYLQPMNMYEAGTELESGTTANAKLAQDIYQMIKERGNDS